MLEERKQMRIISTDEKQESSFRRERKAGKNVLFYLLGFTIAKVKLLQMETKTESL